MGMRTVPDYTGPSYFFLSFGGQIPELFFREV